MSKAIIDDLTDDFRGTQRFDIRQRLGRGGYGTVYRAYDRKRLTSVALKTLHHIDPESLYSFKREFRSLADVAHPNLITLYELMTDGALWFFTMELIEGVNFLEYARSASGACLPFEEKRLRDSMMQLAEGVSAIHDAGKLHRDIKPSNVLVTNEGRAVLLDFGLAAELSMQDSYQSLNIVGTPAYMSPEQASRQPLTKAADWYSVGVMLFEALTGHLPFDGMLRSATVEKQLSEAPSPTELMQGIPEDLDELCRDLLQKDPALRPSGNDILRRLDKNRSAARTVIIPSAPSPIPETKLVGRDKQLYALWKAYKNAKAGTATAVYLQGRSGMGKTALALRFLDELRQSDEKAVILTGRCYKQESVPYKALDSIMDALSSYLKGLPHQEAEAVLPADAAILSRLFPVLRQIAAISGARRTALGIPDSNELRRRAFAALRELLARLADRSPTVLFIDDLQWGDLDSASLLGEILRPPDPPAILLIGTYRSEEIDDSPFLKAFHSSKALTGQAADMLEMSIDELSIIESMELAFALSGRERLMTFAKAEAIARESGGNPFFVNELVRYAKSSASEGMDDDKTAALDEVITARAAQLPVEARHMLEVVAASGRPLERSAARRAMVCIEDEDKTLSLLIANHMVRATGADDREEIEVYHDRIRETVLSKLPADNLRSLHRNLALALEASKHVDPERLVTHFQEAGDVEKAAEYAIAAAEKASEALAFDRAARLYGLTLGLLRTEEESANGERRTTANGSDILPLAFRRSSLQAKLADALAKAGRGAESAAEYLTAAREAKGAEAIEYRRRAAKQYLCSGHIDEGLAVIRDVLGRVGVETTERSMRSPLGLLWRRAQIRLRGLGFRERDESEIPAKELIKIDTCWSVSIGLGIVDTILGADFQSRHLLLALKAGEPFRAVRALAMEIGYSAVPGARSRSRTEMLIKKTREAAEKNGHPHAIGLTALMTGIAAFVTGRWVEGFKLCGEAEEILHERCTGVSWELDTSRLIQLRCLFYFGELNEMSRRLPALIKDAQERGDLYAVANLIGRILYSAHLAADEPKEACAKLKQALEGWSARGFYYQHYFNLIGRVDTELYSGCGDEAWRLINEQWPSLVDSRLQSFQFVLIESLHTRARSAIAAACEAPISEPLLAAAQRDAKLIEREKTVWGNALAMLLRAGIASLRGLRKEAAELLQSAERNLEAVDMALYAAASRRCRGRLIGGDEGEALIKSVDEWMTARKIKNPQRMSEMLIPGRY